MLRHVSTNDILSKDAWCSHPKETAAVVVQHHETKALRCPFGASEVLRTSPVYYIKQIVEVGGIPYEEIGYTLEPEDDPDFQPPPEQLTCPLEQNPMKNQARPEDEW